MAKIMKVKKARTQRKSGTMAQPITAPVAGGSIITRTPTGPRLYSNPSGKSSGHFVQNCERFVGVSTAALGAFFTQRVYLHPGQPNWLGGISGSFSKYRWHFLKLTYIPICPATTPGLFVMGLGYDMADLVPTTTEIAQSAALSVTTPVWGGFNGSNDLNKYTVSKTPGAVSIVVDVNRLGGASGLSYYRTINRVNFAALSNWDKNFYSGAYVDCTVEGGVTGVSGVGHLFMEYIVELIEPIASAANN